MKRRILVVEDEAGIRENLREMLEAEGFEVEEADCGEDGIRRAISSPPHLVVCDVMMPGKDGFDVLSDLRSRESTGHLPFLFLTARADRSSLRKGMELGAEDYLTKPFSRTELLAAVRTRLDRSESLAAAYRRQLGTLRNTLSRALPHELLTPLNGILGLSGILVQEYETMRRGDMLDIARNISDSGEALHRLVRRFLCYAEMEMAQLDPEALRRLRSRPCGNTAHLVRNTLAHLAPDRIQVLTEASPWIAPEHLEILLRELADLPQAAVVDLEEDRWRATLLPAPGSPAPSDLGHDGSDLGDSILETARRIYGAEFGTLSSGERFLSLPVAPLDGQPPQVSPNRA